MEKLIQCYSDVDAAAAGPAADGGKDVRSEINLALYVVPCVVVWSWRKRVFNHMFARALRVYTECLPGSISYFHPSFFAFLWAHLMQDHTDKRRKVDDVVSPIV